eukprot:6479532-Amphidinium_carterae.1
MDVVGLLIAFETAPPAAFFRRACHATVTPCLHRFPQHDVGSEPLRLSFGAFAACQPERACVVSHGLQFRSNLLRMLDRAASKDASTSRYCLVRQCSSDTL